MRFLILGAVVSALAIASTQPSTAQDRAYPMGWRSVDSPADQSMRGLCVVDDTTVWATGAGGTILRSTDKGESWQSLAFDEAETFDFRDVHAFNADVACIMVAGTPARIYRTEDGGRTWNNVYEDTRDGAFLDALEFWDDQHGIVFGDAIEGRLAIAVTDDGGKTWTDTPTESQPLLDQGEHGFAASGTCLMVHGDHTVVIGLGGQRERRNQASRLFMSNDRGRTWRSVDTGLPGAESAGIFSVEILSDDYLVAVGGDYRNEESDEFNVVYSSDGGETWSHETRQPPSGYRSVVRMIPNSYPAILVATGPNGSDASNDGGKNWFSIDGDGFHTIDFSPSGRFGWAVGSEGRMAVFESGAE